MNNIFRGFLTTLLSVLLIVTFSGLGAKAATKVDLGTANNFAVLAGTTITNTGSSAVTGDLGLDPGSSVTGFPPATLTGTQHISDSISNQAKIDLVAAYNNAASQTPVSTVATELGGTTKTAGNYDSADGTFSITGTLTLDAQDNADAVFIFKTESTLVTANSSVIILKNKAQACNIFWQVSSSATLGTNSTFKGNILALTSITLTTGANVEGRVFARNAAVTLDTNSITKAVCLTSSTPTPTATPTVSSSATVSPTVSTTASKSAATASSSAVPKFPNTGQPPTKNNSTPKYILIGFIALVGILSSMRYTRKRKV